MWRERAKPREPRHPARAAAATLRARCLALIGAIALLAAVISGCTRSCLKTTCDSRPLVLPPSLEENPDPLLLPQVPAHPDPATVADPDRPARFLSLQEAFALALENGTVGLQSLASPGLVSDELVAFGGRGLVTSDAVRVLALAPAAAASEIDRSLARFDPIWATGMRWNKVDEPTQGLSSFRNGSLANFTTTLAKGLPTGGVAGVTFSTDYQLLSSPPTGAFSVINPSYTPRLTFGVEQPLLRGFGTEINQLRPSFPSSQLFPDINARLGTTASEGILIARLRFDQQRADFERSIMYLLLNVEAAYWKLYGSYVDLYSAEEGLRVSNLNYAISKKKLDAGAMPPEKYSLFKGQFEQFRADRMNALGRVLDNERTLRVLLGLPLEDGNRLVPVDAPALMPYQPNWQAALQDCLTLRPELLIGRKEVETRHRQLLVRYNDLLPDLRLRADYSSIGLGDRLDGPAGQFSNALRSLSGNHFNDWTIGMTLSVPLGFRAEHAALRQARLGLAESYQALKEQERRAQIVLAKQFNQVIEAYKAIEMRRLAREALGEQLRVRLYNVGVGKSSPDEFLALATTQFTQALSQEYQAIVNYNIALASFEFARGTILYHNRVEIAEARVPYCAEVRAVEHEKERTQALVLRERACPPIAPLAEPGAIADWKTAPSLPGLLSKSAPLPTSPGAEPTSPAMGIKIGGTKGGPASARRPEAGAETPSTLPETPRLLDPVRLTPPTSMPPAVAPAALGVPEAAP